MKFSPILLVILLSSLTSFLSATQKAVKPSNIHQLISKWDVNQHLYVKGDIRINDRDLDKLEQWLDENGKNWTVILMKTASGESWKDTRGETYYGMDAVENAVGRGLSNKTAFSKQVHPKTQTRNGAIFLLFLNERKFSYFSSSVYDARHLGKANWQGNLDGKAITAMRNGGRIIDAVKDTIKSIDNKLVYKLLDEKQQRTQQKAHGQAAKLWVARESKQQKILINQLETVVGHFRANKAAKDGDLANPPLNDWREVIDNASSNSNPILAKSAIKGIQNNIKQHRQKIQQWTEDHKIIRGLDQSVAKFEPSAKQTPQELAVVTTAIKQARELHTKGKQDYKNKLRQAQQQYVALSADKAEYQRITAQQQREDAATAKQQKMALTAGGGATGVGLLGLGIYSNRRRRKQKQLAEQLYTEWKSSMKDRVDKLFTTMDRAAIIVGSERDLPQRGYKGETLKQSISAIRNIDKAFILTSSVDSAMEKTKELIYPSNILRKSSNIFRRSNYDEALDLLERRPLETDPNKEKMRVADRGEDTMLGDKTKADKVKMTFTELIGEFDQTLASADQSLELVEHSWETIAVRCEALGKNLDTIETKELELQQSAKQDSMYQLDNLFDKWLPKTREHHEKGLITGKHDPVKALQSDIARADIMAKEMVDTVELTQTLRKTELQTILKHAEELQQLNRSDQWIEQRLIYLNDRLEELTGKGADNAIAEDLKSLSEEVFALRPRAAHASKLAKYTDTKLPADIAAAYASVETTRQDIASSLKLSPDAILREHRAWNPDIILTDAELLRLRAQDILDTGHVNQAQEQSNYADEKVVEANEVVQDTILANETYASSLEEVQRLLDEAKSLAKTGIQTMSELTQRYHSDALLIDPEDNEFGSLTEVEEALHGSERQIHTDIENAQKYYAKGHVLTARHQIANGKNAHQHITGLHGLIAGRLAELSDLEQKNKNLLKSLNTDKLAHVKAMEDKRTSHSTQQYQRQLESAFQHVEKAVAAVHGESNPFKAVKLLAETKDRVKALESRIEADREAYAAAESLYTQLVGQYEQGDGLISNARRDGITDSHRTTDAIAKIEATAERIQSHQKTLKQAHQNWQDLYQEMQQTGQYLSQAKLALKHELESAQQALASIQSASSNVSSAMHWSGSYGVRINGSYGKRALHEAQDALDSGQYQQASSLAATAINSARSAISSAESAVAKIRRVRAAEERSRRMSRRSSSSSIGSGSSGPRSFGSSSSRSSGSSSSSRGSGSGFSRSGW